jgi:hypothetical protein
MAKEDPEAGHAVRNVDDDQNQPGEDDQVVLALLTVLVKQNA